MSPTNKKSGQQKNINIIHSGEVITKNNIVLNTVHNRMQIKLQTMHTTTMFKNTSSEMRQSGTRNVRVLVKSL